MAKVIRGTAGRMRQREEQLEEYGSSLASLLIKQVKITPGARVMHLGSPGAITVARAIAPALETGELVVVVYTYDETEDARAALAGLGNVEVIDSIDDVDPDEPPYDLLTCIIPFQHRRDYVDQLFAAGMRLLARGGTLILAGDRQQGLERHLAELRARGSEVTPLSSNGQFRVLGVTKPGPGGGLVRRSSTS